MSEMKYTGLKLTPRLFEEILIELFDGKQFERSDAIKTVIDYFVEHGGKKENKDYVSVFKKATSYLKDSGLENKGYGIWTLKYHKKEIEEIIEPKTKRNIVEVEQVIGEGEQSIYVYYYDIYERYAKTSNLNKWPCKIGRTDVNPLDRIADQAKTAYPELPHIALIIKCDDSAKLETAIHSVLKYQGAWIEDAPGSEWFNTNPNEIVTIFDSISKQ